MLRIRQESFVDWEKFYESDNETIIYNKRKFSGAWYNIRVV